MRIIQFYSQKHHGIEAALKPNFFDDQKRHGHGKAEPTNTRLTCSPLTFRGKNPNNGSLDAGPGDALEV